MNAGLAPDFSKSPAPLQRARARRRIDALAALALAVALPAIAFAQEGEPVRAAAPPAKAPAKPADRPTGDQEAVDGDPAVRKAAEKEAKPTVPRSTNLTATLVVKVVHPEEVRKAAIERARKAGGWAILVTDTDLHLEVPQDALAATVDDLAAAGIVLQKSLQRVDLTEQIAQVQARLKSKREILERLRTFFADSDTHSTLRIEQSMTQLVVEIEQLQGELNVAESNARMAHVQVSFQYHQKQRITYVRSPFEWLNTLDIDRFVAEY